MKTNNTTTQRLNNIYKKNISRKDVTTSLHSKTDQNNKLNLSKDIKLEIRANIIPEYSIQENNPSDPLVSKKILDSLNSGIINFDQDERDHISSILNKKADIIRKRISNSNSTTG